MTLQSETNALIDLAVKRGYIAYPQAELLKEELEMFPIGGSVTSYMVRRGLLSPAQAAALVEPEESETDEIDEPPPVNTAPAAPPSVASPRMDMPRTELPQTPPLRPSSGASPATDPPAESPPKRPGSITEAIEKSRLAMGNKPAASGQPVTPSVPPRPESKVYQVDEPSDGIGLELARDPATSSGRGINPSPEITELFSTGRQRGCSDLHLTVGKAPYLRQEGRLYFMPEQPLTAAQTRSMLLSVLTADQREILERDRQVDFSFELPGLGRYRANVYHQRLGVEGAFRFIPEEIPTLQGLGLPSVLEKLTTYPQGLNLVTGPGGCGKTTTVAAMLEFINTHRHEHIITVEDPVEYVFRPNACQITQREVGTHTNSFADALRTALRQDPDVIMIGELRDLDTTSIAITAAETGHLVFGTLHTAGAIRTVARILDVYPPSQRQQICMMVAESLRGIISQQLLPRKDEKGRACAMEILIATTGVAQVIKEGKTHQLVSHMQSGRKLGMKSMDDALMDLLKSGVISGNVAYSHAENKATFELMRNQ